MKKLSSVIIFALFANFASAQFGLNAGYRVNEANKWKNYFEEQDFLKSGFTVGIDYWFRLKNKRIEFTPELAFSSFKSDNVYLNVLPYLDVVSLKSQIYSLYFNTNIYFLDLENDCNCPTWGKSSDFLKKGLFLQVTPGLNYFQNSVENNVAGIEKANDIAFSIGAGLGFDIGISNMLTLSPIVSYHYYFNVTWEGLSKPLGGGNENDEANETTDIKQFYAGIRIGIRLDQKNY